MNSSLLAKELINLQEAYQNLLENLLPKMVLGYVPEALDEVCIFWKENTKIVNLFLTTLQGTDTYIYTASTFLDFEQKEHLPFLLFGKGHVFDDPLCAYSEICNKFPSSMLAKNLRERIILTADNNIKLIKNCKGQLLVLPFRLLSTCSRSDRNRFFNVGKQLFLSLFEGIPTLDAFFQKNETIEDVCENLHGGVENEIIFSEKDNLEEPFIVRFRKSQKEYKSYAGEYATEGKVFFEKVFGGIMQAVDIVLSCLEYKCFPCFSNVVSYSYAKLVARSFNDLGNVDSIIERARITLLLSRVCNRDILASVSLEKMLNARNKFAFEDSFFSTLEKNGLLKNPPLDKIALELEKELANFYLFLHKSNQE